MEVVFANFLQNKHFQEPQIVESQKYQKQIWKLS